MKRSNSVKDKEEPKRWTRIHIWKQEKAGQQQEALCMHRFCCWCARHDLAKARGFHVRLGWFSETAWPSNSCVVPMKKPKKLLQMDGRYVANTSDKDLGLKSRKQSWQLMFFNQSRNPIRQTERPVDNEIKKQLWRLGADVAKVVEDIMLNIFRRTSKMSSRASPGWILSTLVMLQ